LKIFTQEKNPPAKKYFPEKYFPGDFFLNRTHFFSRVFELPLPRNAQKRTKKKEEGTYVLFLRAGADVRRFLVLFFLPPLAKEVLQPGRQSVWFQGNDLLWSL
jgi:hypothetical protein